MSYEPKRERLHGHQKSSHKRAPAAMSVIRGASALRTYEGDSPPPRFGRLLASFQPFRQEQLEPAFTVAPAFPKLDCAARLGHVVRETLIGIEQSKYSK